MPLPAFWEAFVDVHADGHPAFCAVHSGVQGTPILQVCVDRWQVESMCLAYLVDVGHDRCVQRCKFWVFKDAVHAHTFLCDIVCADEQSGTPPFFHGLYACIVYLYPWHSKCVPSQYRLDHKQHRAPRYTTCGTLGYNTPPSLVIHLFEKVDTFPLHKLAYKYFFAALKYTLDLLPICDVPVACKGFTRFGPLPVTKADKGFSSKPLPIFQRFGRGCHLQI